MATIPASGAFRFQSDLTDSATGQVDMLTRMYEPTLGRFSSRDVVFGEPTNPVSLNQLVYGVDNPMTFYDPTGMIVTRGTEGGEDECRACTAEILKEFEPRTCEACSPAVNEPPRQVSYARFDRVLRFIYGEMMVHAEDYAEANDWCWLSVTSCWLHTHGPTLFDWYTKVRKGGPWDHKPVLREMLGLSRGDLHFPIRGLSGYELYYDVWSNIHYGYVGRTAGISSVELRAGADWAEGTRRGPARVQLAERGLSRPSSTPTIIDVHTAA